jgi:hypothetical protein
MEPARKYRGNGRSCATSYPVPACPERWATRGNPDAVATAAEKTCSWQQLKGTDRIQKCCLPLERVQMKLFICARLFDPSIDGIEIYTTLPNGSRLEEPDLPLISTMEQS